MWFQRSCRPPSSDRLHTAKASSSAQPMPWTAPRAARRAARAKRRHDRFLRWKRRLDRLNPQFRFVSSPKVEAPETPADLWVPEGPISPKRKLQLKAAIKREAEIALQDHKPHNHRSVEPLAAASGQKKPATASVAEPVEPT